MLPTVPSRIPSPISSRPTAENSAALRNIALEAARQASPALESAFRQSMNIDTKTSSHDLVTRYDSETEALLIQLLTEAVPDSRITGEEGGSHGTGNLEWIIDPIDGTSNFAHGFAMFSVSIAAAYNNEVIAGVVHDPINKLTFSADDSGAFLQLAEGAETSLRPQPKNASEPEHNLVTSFPSAELVERIGTPALEEFGALVKTYSSVRRVISGALELCHAAAGWADVVLGFETKPWDVAAGQFILKQAGGRYLPYGTRAQKWPGTWDGSESGREHLAPHYVGLAPGAQAPTALALAERLGSMQKSASSF